MNDFLTTIGSLKRSEQSWASGFSAVIIFVRRPSAKCETRLSKKAEGFLPMQLCKV